MCTVADNPLSQVVFAARPLARKLTKSACAYDLTICVDDRVRISPRNALNTVTKWGKGPGRRRTGPEFSNGHASFEFLFVCVCVCFSSPFLSLSGALALSRSLFLSHAHFLPPFTLCSGRTFRLHAMFRRICVPITLRFVQRSHLKPWTDCEPAKPSSFSGPACGVRYKRKLG